MSGPKPKANASAGRLADALFGIRARPQDWEFDLPGRRPIFDEEDRIVGIEPAQSVQEGAADELRDLVAEGDVDGLHDLFLVLKKRAAVNKLVRDLKEAAIAGEPLNQRRTDLAWAALAEAWHIGEFSPPEPWTFPDGRPNVEGFRLAVQRLDEKLQEERVSGVKSFLTTALPAKQTIWALLSGPGQQPDAPSSEQSLERTGTERGQHGRQWKRSVATFMRRGKSMGECVKAWARGEVIFEDDGSPDGYDPPEPAEPED